MIAALVPWGDALKKLQGPWTLHASTPNPDAETSLIRSAQGLGGALVSALHRDHPALERRYVEPDDAARRTPRDLHILQVCRIPGGVWSCLSAAGALSDAWPGGVHRMPDDPLAPSRSYSKIEEAFDVMGAAPKAGETAVDLGASPGGWTWAFVKRGCRVFAVDNGPMKLASLGDWGGEVEHLRQDGMRFAPHRAVDWMSSDMLIAPGQALGLVRRWHQGGWARRMIVNFKLPQQNPLAALDPVCAALDALPGFRYRLRQLYHDRREVTLMAECETPPAIQRGPGAGRDGKTPRQHPSRRGASGPAQRGPSRKRKERR